MGSVVRITLDAETFKALASPTRLTVLRALDERRKTLTEISRDLALNKATVHEHLALLAAAELVRKRDDEGRKWIYYELTWRGQKLLHPQETTTFNVLLGLGIAAAGGGMGLLARSLYTALEPHVEGTFQPPETLGSDAQHGPERAAISADSTSPEGTSASTTASPAASSASGTSSSAPGSASGTYSTTATSTASSTSAPAAGGAGTSQNPGTAFNDAADTDKHAEAPATPAASHGFLDDAGTLGLALLGFAALMALLAWLLRRHLRADPFRPPPGPPDQ
jgi:DNA-binding transcriptional ArsR family regulator